MFLKYESGIVKLGIVISEGSIFTIGQAKSSSHDMSVLIAAMHVDAGAVHVAAIAPVDNAQILFFFITIPFKITKVFHLAK